jgi:hypothetical protein
VKIAPREIGVGVRRREGETAGPGGGLLEKAEPWRKGPVFDGFMYKKYVDF